MLNKYRWYLMNSVIWSFAFNTMSTFSGTITLFPLPCYYGINIASRLHGNYQIAYFFVTVNCLTCKCVAVAMQIEHRFNCTLSRNSLWCRLVSGSVRYEVCFRIGIYVACFLITNVSAYFTFPNQQQQHDFLVTLDPSLELLYIKHPDLTCFSYKLNLYILIPICSLFVISCVLLYKMLYVTYYNIYHNYYSSATRRLQIMLFNSLLAQSVLITVLAFVPAFLLFVLPLFGMRHMPQISVICIMGILTHTPLDCVLMLMFIAPYRRFLHKQWKWLFGRETPVKTKVIIKTTIYLDEPGAELLDSESLIPSDPTIVPFSKTNVITPVDSKNDDNNQKSLQSVTTFSPDSRFNMDNIRRSMENIKNNLDSIKFTDSSKQPYPSLPYEYTSKYEKLPLPPELPNSRLLPLSEFHLGGSEVSDFGMYWSKTSGNDEQLRQGKRFEYIPEKISRNKNGEYKIDVKEGRFEEREGSIRARAVIVNRDGQPHFSVDLKLIINEIQMRRRIYHVREFNVDDRLMRIAKELAIDILASRRIQLNNRDANVWIGGSNIDHAKVVDEWCREMAASKQNYFKSRDFYSVGVGMASDDHDEKLTVVVSVYE